MAEILFLQRANHRAADDFERMCDGTLLPMERTYFTYETEMDDKGQPVVDTDGKPKVKKVEQKMPIALQIGRREYKIVGLAVPDAQVNKVLNALNVGDGEVHPLQAQLMTTALRKMMGAKPIPKKADRGDQIFPLPREGVAIYPIGVREDKESVWWDEKAKQPFKQENI